MVAKYSICFNVKGLHFARTSFFNVFYSILGINGDHFASRHRPIARSDVLFSEVRAEA